MIEMVKKLITLVGQILRATFTSGINAILDLIKYSGISTVPKPSVQARESTPLGPDAQSVNRWSVNGRIHPWGRPTSYWFEYGVTPAYGDKTPETYLPPRIGAYYRESWDKDNDLAGWNGNLGANTLTWKSGGVGGGGYVSYELGDVGGTDQAHEHGIGCNVLTHFVFTTEDIPDPEFPHKNFLGLAGGEPDFRGAKIKCYMRGSAQTQPPPGRPLNLKRAELTFWAQSAPPGVVKTGYTASNWAYTGVFLTDAVLAGGWQPVSYVLDNDTNAWTYAGYSTTLHGGNQSQYVYVPLDQVLRQLNLDIFHMMVLIDAAGGTDMTWGQLNFDELEIAYRNYSLLIPSNGGKLMAAPPGGDPPERLTDGWRNGTNRMWQSASFPSAALEFVYKLAGEFTIDVVQLHQNNEWPSEAVDVFTSPDGLSTPVTAVNWTLLFSDVIPQSHVAGPNFNYLLKNAKNWPGPVKASWIKVKIKSGYKPDAWGLGEIEVFGRGPLGLIAKTEHDWYGVTADLPNLEKDKTYYWKLIARSAGGTVEALGTPFKIPKTQAPLVKILRAFNIKDGTAKIEARVAPMGLATTYFFEYGTSVLYDTKMNVRSAGEQVTPRTVTDILGYDEVDPYDNVIASRPKLASNTDYYVRLTATNADGTAYATYSFKTP
jgi:hypothetical protein